MSGLFTSLTKRLYMTWYKSGRQRGLSHSLEIENGITGHINKQFNEGGGYEKWWISGEKNNFSPSMKGLRNFLSLLIWLFIMRPIHMMSCVYLVYVKQACKWIDENALNQYARYIWTEPRTSACFERVYCQYSKLPSHQIFKLVAQAQKGSQKWGS